MHVYTWDNRGENAKRVSEFANEGYRVCIWEDYLQSWTHQMPYFFLIPLYDVCSHVYYKVSKETTMVYIVYKNWDTL